MHRGSVTNLAVAGVEPDRPAAHRLRPGDGAAAGGCVRAARQPLHAADRHLPDRLRAAMVALYWQDDKNESTFGGMFRADGLTVFLSLMILVGRDPLGVVSASYVETLEGRMPIGEFYMLLAFSVLGAMLVAAAGDLVMIFVGIELSSLATYVLTAFAKRRADLARRRAQVLPARYLRQRDPGLRHGLDLRADRHRPTSTRSALRHSAASPARTTRAVAAAGAAAPVSSVSASRSRRCRSTCGRRTPTTARRRRSPPSCRSSRRRPGSRR